MARLALRQGGELVDGNAAVRPVKDRIRQAREHRKQFEPTWQSNMAFASGKHWLVWDRNSRTLRRIQDVNPAYRNRELYSADIITEYRMTALGELAADSERPDLLLQRDDQFSEDFQGALNRAMDYGWNYEWRADEVLAEADRLCVDLGTSAIRCRFDPTVGPMKAADVPHMNGRPLLNLDEARQQVMAAASAGQTLSYKPIREGRIRWDPLSAFNLLVPPGTAHERDFAWECVVQPVLLSKVVEEYGSLAGELKEDGDISSVLGLDAKSQQSGEDGGLSYATGDARQNRLRDHVWLFHYYERPSGAYPDGRVLVFASNSLKLLSSENRLPYERPDGTRCSGIAYLHWWRVTGRFWSRALVEALKDPQRAMAKRRTQSNEIIDRGMPFVLVEEGSNAKRHVGVPVEMIELKPGERQPIISGGIGPGPWMYQDVEQIREDIDHASGIKAPKLGENPANVNTYSQLALIHEADATKRQPILLARRRAISELIEASVYDIRNWWGPQKQIALAGDEDQAQVEMFDATRIPTFFIVKVAKGASKPRSAAAELKKVEDLAAYSLNSRAPLPVSWLKSSFEAGQALDLPEEPGNDQADKAQLENHLLLIGHDVPPTYYDPIQVHLPIHRSAQIQAEMSGNLPAWERMENHIQQHQAIAQQNAERIAAAAAGPPGGASPGAPGVAAGPPAAPGAGAPPPASDLGGQSGPPMPVFGPTSAAQLLNLPRTQGPPG